MMTPDEELATIVRAHQDSKGKTNRFDNNTLPLRCSSREFIPDCTSSSVPKRRLPGLVRCVAIVKKCDSASSRRHAHLITAATDAQDHSPAVPHFAAYP